MDELPGRLVCLGAVPLVAILADTLWGPVALPGPPAFSFVLYLLTGALVSLPGWWIAFTQRKGFGFCVVLVGMNFLGLQALEDLANGWLDRDPGTTEQWAIVDARREGGIRGSSAGLLIVRGPSGESLDRLRVPEAVWSEAKSAKGPRVLSLRRHRGALDEPWASDLRVLSGN